jgi:hypothetical protein
MVIHGMKLRNFADSAGHVSRPPERAGLGFSHFYFPPFFSDCHTWNKKLVVVSSGILGSIHGNVGVLDKGVDIF